MGFDKFCSTAQGNLSTSNSNTDVAPTNITNGGGDGGDSGCGLINDVNVQNITEVIILEINGGVGNYDYEELVYDTEKENY